MSQQLTVKQVIASTLLRICREATDSVRPKEEPKPRKYSKEEVEQIHAMLRNLGWSTEKVALQGRIYAALFNAPELNVPVMIPLAQFCVVVLDSNDGGHGYAVGEPHIVTSTSGMCLHTDGHAGRWIFDVRDRPRLATDDEIEYCIESLTEAQWVAIKRQEVFIPIMDAAMAQAVTVDMEPVVKDSEEHTLPDGRKITVDTE